MAVYEQILSILAAHPKGLPIDGMMAVAAKMPRNEIMNKAALSQNLYGLRNSGANVEYVGDGYRRNYLITENGKQKLLEKGYDLDKLSVPIFGVDVGLADKGRVSHGTKQELGCDEEAMALDVGLDSVEQARKDFHDELESFAGGSTGTPRTESLSPPNGVFDNNPSVNFSIDDLRQVLDGYAPHPCIKNKTNKIMLLETLADFCQDSASGALLLEIKGDLEMMGGGD